jgi:hypothetical protein
MDTVAIMIENVWKTMPSKKISTGHLLSISSSWPLGFWKDLDSQFSKGGVAFAERGQAVKA